MEVVGDGGGCQGGDSSTPADDDLILTENIFAEYILGTWIPLQSCARPGSLALPTQGLLPLKYSMQGRGEAAKVLIMIREFVTQACHVSHESEWWKYFWSTGHLFVRYSFFLLSGVGGAGAEHMVPALHIWLRLSGMPVSWHQAGK